MTLYRPTDIDAANASLGASCGHAALAAITGREVKDVWHSARLAFEARQYVSAPAMEDALSLVVSRLNWRHGSSARVFPVRGLVLIQWEGPWMAPGLPFGAQLARTHWIAVDRTDAGEMIYDINQDGWRMTADWERATVPQIIATIKRATGAYHVRKAYEVQPNILPSVIKADAYRASPA